MNYVAIWGEHSRQREAIVEKDSAWCVAGVKWARGKVEETVQEPKIREALGEKKSAAS